ncbi:hypothetical protein GCM10022243_37920 [Saccharothrix violaceirubra]|uniref:CBM11 domain-containing protein n=1 Tax=Saccharothrix violaceirubra TaxID=413306 RepID=A0A7W7T4A5_9PSEU|nr:hypothetical protein [Saccharothrix violaceirubra]MBB4966294.1 hypothetical protein [Saccharothrix violaceirubra]
MRLTSPHSDTPVTFGKLFTAFALGLALVLLGSGTIARAAAHDARRNCECSTPSIDRYQQWLASGEGTTVPATGSLLVREGRGYAAKVQFLKDEWHVVVVWLGNKFESQADLSKSSGFWLTYSATDDLYLQLRPASHWSGGDKWLVKIPATGGKRVQKFVAFTADQWTWLPELGKPAYSFESALTDARGFVFVGKTPNRIDFRGLRIDRYQPPCV